MFILQYLHNYTDYKGYQAFCSISESFLKNFFIDSFSFNFWLLLKQNMNTNQNWTENIKILHINKSIFSGIQSFHYSTEYFYII